MFKIKKAFTLFELMVVMFVIGVIATVTLAIQKSTADQKYSLLYQRAYVALSQASYNIKLDLVTDEDFPTTPNDFCTKLAKIDTGYFNTSSVTCNSNAIGLNADSFPENAVQFVASNGMKFYISAVQTKTLNSIDYLYRIVFVDLNGDNKPNTAQWQQNKMADIVGFVVFDSGDVLPIGYPEADKRYFTAQVAYPDTETETDQYSPSMSFYDAKWTAWGNEYNSAEMLSINFNDDALFAASNLKVDYSKFPAHPAVDAAKTCVANTLTTSSPCEVEITEYSN